MQNSQSKLENGYLIVLTLTAWFALILQFYLHMISGVASPSELLIRFFSYFTVDSNLLTALCCTFILCLPNTKLGRFFGSPSVKSAIAVYITVVMLIFNTLLRFILSLEGWSVVANELLHVIVPLLFIIYWIYFVPKHQLKWSNILTWMLYPLLYILFVLVRGSYADFYPYPFLNVAKFGLQKVLFNAVMIALLFGLLSAIFVAAGKRKNKSLSS